MSAVTVLFLFAAASLIAAVLYALRMMGNRTDSLYTEVMLSDAEYAITREDRAAIEADAFTEASTGWDMPDYAEHHEAAKALVEVYDLEQEMLADLDSVITAFAADPRETKG